MSKGLLRGALSLITGLLFLIGLQIQAAVYYVGVDGSGFSPATLPIEVGDTVIWVNNDDTFPHTTTSDLPFFNANYWDGTLVDQSDTFSQTFNNAGTFTYRDQLDIGTGTIIVSVPSATPVITLESPRLTGGQFLFEATGLTVGKTNVLLSSTNLTSWTSIRTNVAAGSSMTFTNATSPGQRFFQVMERP